MAKTKGAKTVKPEDASRYIDQILQSVSAGLSVRQALEVNGIPLSKDWFHVRRREDENIQVRWNVAKASGCWALHDQIEDALDDLDRELRETQQFTTPEGETVTEPKTDPKMAAAMVQAMRLRVDARKWTIGKLLPKQFGDKLAVTDGDGNQVSFTMNLTPAADKDEGS